MYVLAVAPGKKAGQILTFSPSRSNILNMFREYALGSDCIKAQSERLPSGKKNNLAPLNQCLNEAMIEIERKEDTCNEEKENAITRD